MVKLPKGRVKRDLEEEVDLLDAMLTSLVESAGRERLYLPKKTGNGKSRERPRLRVPGVSALEALDRTNVGGKSW